MREEGGPAFGKQKDVRPFEDIKKSEPQGKGGTASTRQGALPITQDEIRQLISEVVQTTVAQVLEEKFSEKYSSSTVPLGETLKDASDITKNIGEVKSSIERTQKDVYDVKATLVGRMDSIKSSIQSNTENARKSIEQSIEVANRKSNQTMVEIVAQQKRSEQNLSSAITKGVVDGVKGAVTDAAHTSIKTSLDSDRIAKEIAKVVSTELNEVATAADKRDSDDLNECKDWVLDNANRISSAAITSIFAACYLLAGLFSVAAYLLMPRSLAMAGIFFSASVIVLLAIVNWVAAARHYYDNSLWRPIYYGLGGFMSLVAMIVGLCALFC